MNRRGFISGSSVGLAAASLGTFDIARAGPADSDGVRAFHISVPESQIVDLRRRIAATRWPDRETVDDSSQGVQLATMQSLAQYWATSYDWREIESRLNSLPQYVTNIEGLDIHFIHVRSKHGGALPLIITHGWPGSIVEQLKIIDPLTNPTAHSASAADAFDLVVPSMPGYGFSSRPTITGWDTDRIAKAWVLLMKRLGYSHFVAQGGDWGAGVVEAMARQTPPGLLGIHVNLPGTVPPDIAKALLSGNPPPSALSGDELRAYEQLIDLYAKKRAYATFMATRPQTLYGIADSPIGLAAWMIDHGDGYSQPAAAILCAVQGRSVDGHSAGAITRDDVLDDITLYWLTNTGVSSGRLYWENKVSLYNAAGVSVPAAVSVFPGENYQAPHSWTESAYHNLIYFNEVAAGGHYAAWEQPQLFSEEVRAGFRSLRR